MNKKLIFLFIALLLPGLIYTFLKVFGSNSFYVVPLYQSKTDDQNETDVPEGCAAISYPYVVPGNVLTSIAASSERDSLFLVFYMIDEATLGSTAGNINEIEAGISGGKDGVQLVKVTKDTLGLKCYLLMKPSMDIVLLDKANRIRGQYKSTDRDDVDRLSTELDIILKKY